jgi:hypothetical protein
MSGCETKAGQSVGIDFDAAPDKAMGRVKTIMRLLRLQLLTYCIGTRPTFLKQTKVKISVGAIFSSDFFMI